MAIAQETVLEINLTKLKHNFDFIKSQLADNTKFIAVVKAFAYGNDAAAIATYLQNLEVDYFAVAYVSEGINLRKAGIHKPIIVLHPQPVNFKLLIEHCLEPNLYSFKVLNEFMQVSENLKQCSYPVHIKFNTGLNRLGFVLEDVKKITEITNNQPFIKISSIFSHLAASEDLNERLFTQQQISRFQNIKTDFKTLSNHNPFSHITNTSGILNYPEAHFDAVRSGIGLYGFGNSKDHDKKLHPIACLKSIISQIHLIEPGESIGYNRAFTANKPMKTATIPVGHADGISRKLGNKNYAVLVNNQPAKIIGNVCMDMMMVDVTNIDCNEGDEIIIFNSQKMIQEIANNSETIPYETLTAISQRVKRLLKC